jgi:hypothetical protein
MLQGCHTLWQDTGCMHPLSSPSLHHCRYSMPLPCLLCTHKQLHQSFTSADNSCAHIALGHAPVGRLWPAQEWLHQGQAHHPHSHRTGRRSSSSSQGNHFAWSSADYAAAAAGASRLTEDELHNLFFDTGSSSSRTARAAAKKLKRARRRQRQQAADAWQYWWDGRVSDSDADEEGSSHWGYSEDWKWWDDEQER